MKFLILIYIISFLVFSDDGFAQIKSTDEQNLKKDYDEIRLTVDMFFHDQNLLKLSSYKTVHNPLFDRKATQVFLILGSNVIHNNVEYNFRPIYPRTVSEYNRAIHNRFFDAEPTSQQRRTLPFRFN